MQYILTEQEYKALTPINKVNELEENVRRNYNRWSAA